MKIMIWVIISQIFVGLNVLTFHGLLRYIQESEEKQKHSRLIPIK